MSRDTPQTLHTPLFVRTPELEQMRNPLDAEWNLWLARRDQTDSPWADSIDFSHMSEIFQNFLEVVGLPVAIVDLNARVLASSNWQRVCMEFHRAHPQSLQRCLESDTQLSQQMREGKPYAIYRCRNGLTDCAAPIVVEGRHVATLFIGQFLLAAPDLVEFQHQQETFGFDKEAYFKALAEVPIVAEDKLPAILNLLTSLAQQVARQSLAEKRALIAYASVERQVVERTRQLGASHDLLRKLSAQVPGMIFQFRQDAKGHSGFPYASAAAQALFELAPEDIRDSAQPLFQRVHPEDGDAVRTAIRQSAATLAPWLGEFRVRLPRQGERWLETRATPERLPDGSTLWHGFIADIGQRKTAEAALRESEEKLRKLYDLSPLGIALADMDGRFIEFNEAFRRICGYAEAELKTLDYWRLTPPEYAESEARQLHILKTTGRYGPYEKEYLRRDGSRVPLRLNGVLVRGREGQAYIWSIAEDITERKQAEALLLKSREQYMLAVNGSHDGIWDWDLRDNSVFFSAVWKRMIGYEDDELPNEFATFERHLHPEDRPRVMAKIRRYLKGQEPDPYTVEFRFRHKDGGYRWILARGTALRDEQSVAYRMAGSHSDITERKRAESKILNLAFYDPLTGLPNRRLLMDRLGHALATSHRSRQFGALLFMDLDRFKILNDTQGHDVGDKLLVKVAQRLVDTVRASDTVARLGGDEFVVLLEGLSTDETTAATHAEICAEKISAALNQPYALEDRDHDDYHGSASIGVCLFRDSDESVDSLLKHADVALYQAKDAGRNAIRFYNPAMQATLDARIALETGLRRALAQEEFQLYFQPQTDRQGRVVGAEVLLRWLPPGRPPVSPAQFIPLAEETGLILPIGAWILDTVCACLKAWEAYAAMRELQLAVNISARQFRHPDFVAQVEAALARHGADPSRLKLELTESMLLDNIEDIIAKMTRLQGLGVGFSLDDFGTGYSSLAYLKRLPLDQLKIDQTFVRDVTDDPDDAAIVQAIIGLGQILRLQVIAEGVENPAQWEFLDANGCDAFQGYLFGRPVPRQDFEGLLRVPSPRSFGGGPV